MPDIRHRAANAIYITLLVLPLAGFMALENLFAPNADLWPKWQAHNPTSTIKVDHRAWGVILKKYVSTDSVGVNRVAYGKVTDADETALHAYLSALRTVNVADLNRGQQLAYWINLYNALTVRLIIQFYPVESIRDISLGGGLFNSGPWDEKLIRINGEMVSLNDIEHRILRPIWKDPRIHYAVNCAAIGCPNLAKTPFTAATADASLNALARDYVNHPRGARLAGDGLVLSKIYAWFVDDFGADEAGVLEHLSRYLSVDKAAKFKRATGIDDYEYDWSLNDAVD